MKTILFSLLLLLNSTSADSNYLNQAIPPVQPTTAAIVNGADYQPTNHIAAKQHGSIFGSNMTPLSGFFTASDSSTLELNGTTVFLEYSTIRIQCILSFVSAGQINIVTPGYEQGLPYVPVLQVSFKIYYNGSVTAVVPSVVFRDLLGRFFTATLADKDADGVHIKVPAATVDFYDGVTGQYLGNQLLYKTVNGEVVSNPIIKRTNNGNPVIQYLVMYGTGFLANNLAMTGDVRLVTGNVTELPVQYIGSSGFNLGQANIKITNDQGNLLVPTGRFFSYIRFGNGTGVSNSFTLEFN